MNDRPRWPLFLFLACTAAVLVALGYVTTHALRLEAREVEAHRRAAVEESARLALWRMDSALAPLIARESARPYFHYVPFYAADRAYTSMWEEVRPGELMIPSPLLTASDPLVRLHFQLSPSGEITSPQAPIGNMRDMVETAHLPAEDVIEAERRLAELSRSLGDGHALFASLCTHEHARSLEDSLRERTPPQPARQTAAPPQLFQQQAELDYQARQQASGLARNIQINNEENRARRAVGSRDAAPEPATEPAPAAALSAKAGPADPPPNPPRAADADLREVSHGEMTALWRNGPGEPALLLVRIVSTDGAPAAVQGAWLDWHEVQQLLLAQVGDAMPAARLSPLVGADAEPSSVDPGRRLAAIPAVLDVGEVPEAPRPRWTTMRTTLAISWLAVLGAVALTGVALRSAAELAARRGRFVSAVTHELRTPLTTFCLYTQMLSDGVVADEQARREYLLTLRAESQRLARIVETVLQFARLGRPAPSGRAPARPAVTIAVGAMMERILPHLHERATQAGAELRTEIAPSIADARIQADADAVEQILTNLVENACKYAGGRPIDLRVDRSGSGAIFSVADRGPGIPPADRKRLFRPFQRGSSLEHATIPGLGLGLALSRELARRHRGDLVLTRTSAEGTVFTLTLPLAES